jgi:hypothetical protein
MNEYKIGLHIKNVYTLEQLQEVISHLQNNTYNWFNFNLGNVVYLRDCLETFYHDLIVEYINYEEKRIVLTEL